LKAAGLSPRSFGGRNLLAQVERHRRADGSIAGYVSYTAFGILALRAAGERAGASTVSWLVRSQNDDGGFGVAPSSASDTDMTGAVLQALAVTGRARSATAGRAVAYLRGNQGADGGFAQMRGRSANSQSTSYAIQGLEAVGAAAGAVRRAISYLAGLQRRDGSISYSTMSRQTPVWVTAQALAALRRKPLPLATVPRERPRRQAAREAAPAEARAGGGASAEDGGGSTSGAAGGTVASGPAAATKAAGSREAGDAAESPRSSQRSSGKREADESGPGVSPGAGLALDPEMSAGRPAERADERPGMADGGLPAGVIAGAAAVVLGLVLALLGRRLLRRLARGEPDSRSRRPSLRRLLARRLRRPRPTP
jgi:hypothetical protein